ncbi:MMPL family transporter [Candidatus Nanohaloarchaea archaeon]|nr:MMPL family transporter [Candidatus Nanohaloarchaea archaeon]
MNGKVDRALEKYSDTIESRPLTVLAVAVMATAVLASGASKVQTEQMSQEDLLPDSMPTMEAFSVISSEFSTASGTSYTILIETAPQYPNSTEIRDLRQPEALRFMKAVSDDLSSRDKISSVSGPSDLFRGSIPSSKTRVDQAFRTLGEARWSNYVSSDYTAAIMRVDTVEMSTSEQMQLANQIRQTVRSHEKPAGLDISYTGQPFIDKAFQQQTQKTMSITGAAALLGVILVVVLLFRSLFYGFTSLLTLVFGVTAGFGIFGWLGLNMSPATSGAITMGIGVAIDFGIQPISRYIEERENFGIEKSLEETIKGIVTPMTVGLIAANIGFLSLNVGRVTFLSDLGTLLTLTTTMAYVAAFTVIPSSLVIYDRYFTRNGTSGFTLSKITGNSENSTKGESQ